MLFERRLREGIHDGRVTLAFRRWRRPQVTAGGRYRTGLDIVVVESLEVVSEDELTAQDALAAGYSSVPELRADVRGSPDLSLYRLGLRRLDEPDPRAELARSNDLDAAAVADLTRALDRLGSWTGSVLVGIRDRPGVRAADLAEAMGTDVAVFKRNVRKLKNLGLTISLERGYRLSPRGVAYLESLERRGQGN
jgi:hypothetical protein